MPISTTLKYVQQRYQLYSRWVPLLFRLLFRLQVFRSITLNIFMIQMLCAVMHCLRVDILVWMLLEDISDLILLSRTVQRVVTYLWLLFHLLQGWESRSYIFKALPMKNNWYLDMDFNSKVCGLWIVVLEVWKAAYFFESWPSIINPVNKLYSVSLTKFNRPFSFRHKKKTRISEQHDTSFLLYSYWNVFYLVKVRNLSRNSSVRELARS